MTKILAFSDVHCATKICESLVQKSDEVDLVIGAGDFGNMRGGLDITFPILGKIQKPFVIVPGNAESVEELKDATSSYGNIHVLHGDGITLFDIPMFGIGGGIPVTPFGSWSYDFTEEQAQELLSDCPESGILISHSPPKGAVDRTSTGKSIGSIAIRDTIVSRKTKLCVCGHVHDCGGTSEMLDQTQVVNAGPIGLMLDYS